MPDAAQTAGYNLLISTWVYIWLPVRLQPCLQRGLGTKLTLEEEKEEEVCTEPSKLERRDLRLGDRFGGGFGDRQKWGPWVQHFAKGSLLVGNMT